MKHVLAFALALSAGCATDDTGPIDETLPKQHMTEATNPTFTLFVSNQSLDRDVVDIEVRIDGQLAVTGDFDVWSGHDDGSDCGGPRIAQHNWYEFGFDLAPGPHQITVTSQDVTATLTTTVAVGQDRYGVIDYWFDAETPDKFDFFASATKPGFE